MPMIALVDGQRLRADRDGPRHGTCPGCGGTLTAKTGRPPWHWAHRAPNAPCPMAGETEWHLAWKARVDDLDRIEVTRGQRVADLTTPYGCAVALRDSSTTIADCLATEADWGHVLTWVVNAGDAYADSRLAVKQPRDHVNAHVSVFWDWAPDWLQAAQCRMFLDLGQGWLIMMGGWQPKSHGPGPTVGYGWPIGAAPFALAVLNGRRPPIEPRPGQPLDPTRWIGTADRAAACAG